jgi:hypothetical protein
LWIQTVVYQFDGWIPALRPAIGRNTSVLAKPARAGIATAASRNRTGTTLERMAYLL